MPDTMVDRLVLALADEFKRQGDTYCGYARHEGGDSIVLDGGFDLRDVAQVMLGAMRDPTAWMIDEMCGRLFREHRTDRVGVTMLRCWRAACDAASVDDPGNPETQAILRGDWREEIDPRCRCKVYFAAGKTDRSECPIHE